MWILDVQGFQLKYSSEFICKELALMNVRDCCCKIHAIFKFGINLSEFKDEQQKHLRYTTNFIHGHNWNDGEIPYTDLNKILHESGLHEKSYILVKELQKQQWLQQLLPNFENIKNIEEIEYTSSIKGSCCDANHCHNHYNNNLNCALQNVHLLQKWINLNSVTSEWFDYHQA